jgi:hypothetical protein
MEEDEEEATLLDPPHADLSSVGLGRGGNGSVVAPTVVGSPVREKKGSGEQAARPVPPSGGQGALVPDVEGKKGKGGKKKGKGEDPGSTLELAYNTLADNVLLDENGARRLFKIHVKYLRCVK